MSEGLKVEATETWFVVPVMVMSVSVPPAEIDTVDTFYPRPRRALRQGLPAGVPALCDRLPRRGAKGERWCRPDRARVASIRRLAHDGRPQVLGPEGHEVPG